MQFSRCFLIILFIPFLAWSNDPEKVFVTADHVYEPQIQTVLFYPVKGEGRSLLDFPVLNLQKPQFLALEFDELGDQYKNYNFKLIHCNHDWKQSILSDFEFLQEYNEFTVDNYEISTNTRNTYIHYNFVVPRVKVSGNYVLKVYRSQNQEDLIITRRFIVYDSKVVVQMEPKFALDPGKRFSHQQMDFTINYGDYHIYNPREMIKVVARQNGRWDNAIYNLQPMFLKEEEHFLDYHFYMNENVFPGTNEYRGFDIRSLRFRGQNISNVTYNDLKAEAFVIPDVSRNKRNLTQYIDLNGRYVIENFETRQGSVEADYVDIYFKLMLNEPTKDKVYLFGLLTDWELRPEFRMTPDSSNNRVLLGHTKVKQGFYNYSYVVVGSDGKPDEIALEGSYSQAENMYDIMVYFRPLGGRYDQLVGYSVVDYNKLR